MRRLPLEASSIYPFGTANELVRSLGWATRNSALRDAFLLGVLHAATLKPDDQELLTKLLDVFGKKSAVAQVGASCMRAGGELAQSLDLESPC